MCKDLLNWIALPQYQTTDLRECKYLLHLIIGFCNVRYPLLCEDIKAFKGEVKMSCHKSHTEGLVGQSTESRQSSLQTAIVQALD